MFIDIGYYTADGHEKGYDGYIYVNVAKIQLYYQEKPDLWCICTDLMTIYTDTDGIRRIEDLLVKINKRK